MRGSIPPKGSKHFNIMKKRGYAAIGIQDCKDHKNIAGALRAVGCYDADLLITTGSRYKGSKIDTRSQHKHTPYIQPKNHILDFIPYTAKVVAVDLIEGSTPLPEFVHPEAAYYVFGGEDRTLREDVLDRADHIVHIPTDGCMNLAATINVVLYDRLAKQCIQK